MSSPSIRPNSCGFADSVQTEGKRKAAYERNRCGTGGMRLRRAAGRRIPRRRGGPGHIKQLVTNRLKRIEGQIRGTRKMVQEERYCSDVLTQVASVQEAVRAVGREALLHHLRHCATAAIRSGDVAQAETVYREILETAFRSR